MTASWSGPGVVRLVTQVDRDHVDGEGGGHVDGEGGGRGQGSARVAVTPGDRTRPGRFPHTAPVPLKATRTGRQ